MKQILCFATTLIFSFIFSTTTIGASYFWVGGSGNWSDLNHWATTSGGIIHPTSLPSAADDIFFDNNSFLTNGCTVTVNVPTIDCRNFSWITFNTDTQHIDFGNTIVNCVEFTAYPNWTRSTIAAQNATFNCDSLFHCSLPGTLGTISAYTVVVSNATITEVTTETYLYAAWPDTNTSIARATIGSDTCTICGLYTHGIHIGNAILKGLDFEISKFEHWTTNHNDFDTLQLATPGGTYTFSDSDTVYIHNALLINSQPGGIITAQNSVSNNWPITFMCDMNTVCVDYVQLQNVRGGGTTQYYAGANSIDAGNNANWQFVPCLQAVDYYWVGGTGNWSDLNHWATTSGGSIHPSVLPSTFDDIHFDFNSFPTSGCTVTVNVPTINCRNFTWQILTLDTQLIDFGNAVVNCNLFSATPYYTRGIIAAQNATFNCDSMFVSLLKGTVGMASAPIVSLANVTVNEVIADKGLIAAFPDTAVYINKATVGTDTCANCYVRSHGFHIGNAILKGLNFEITKIGYKHHDFDTLQLATPGGTYAFSDTDTVYVHNRFIVNSQPGGLITIKNQDDPSPVTFMCDMSSVCIDYAQLNWVRGGGTTQFYAGANSIDLGNNTGWQFTTCFTPNVWPGDANYDLTANNVDVLNIGIAYGEVGPLRPGATNTWIAQPMTDWPSFFVSGINKKHADCDGNGAVDFADTVAISLNYGLTHPARFGHHEPEFSSVDPSLILSATPDSVPASANVHIDIDFGTSAIPVDSIYGIAFTLNYDPNIVDADSISVDFNGSWLGTVGLDVIGFTKPFPGQIHFALCRNNHTNIIGGFGHLAALDVVIVDNISTITDSPLRLTDVTALTYSEYVRTVNTIDDTLFVRPFTGNNDHPDLAGFFSIYPNPAAGDITVRTQNIEIYSIEMVDMQGRIVLSSLTGGKNHVLRIDSIAAGVYTLRCLTGKGTYNHRVEVIH